MVHKKYLNYYTEMTETPSIRKVPQGVPRRYRLALLRQGWGKMLSYLYFLHRRVSLSILWNTSLNLNIYRY